jgi:PAS domain S-box-containing protein
MTKKSRTSNKSKQQAREKKPASARTERENCHDLSQRPEVRRERPQNPEELPSVPFCSTSDLIGSVSVGTDITGQKRADAALAVVHDTTEHRRAEHKAMRQSKVIESINRIFREAVSTDPEESLGGICLAAAEEITGSKFGFIGEINEDGRLDAIAISNPGFEAWRMPVGSGHRMVPKSFEVHGVYGRVLLDGKSLYTNEPTSHADGIGILPGRPPLEAFLGVPLNRNGKTTGIIAVGNRPGGYTDDQLEDLEALAPAVVEAFSRKCAEEALRQSEQNLAIELKAAEVLQQLSTKLIQADRVEILYEQILDAALAIAHADFASIQRFHPERGTDGELELLGFRGFNELAAKFWEWVSPVSRSTCSEALRTGQRVVVTDIKRCDFMAETEDLKVCLENGIRAAQTTPLLSRTGQILGMFSTHWREPYEPAPNEMRALDILARQAADLLERLETARDLQRSRDELEARIQERTAELQKINERLKEENRERIRSEQFLRLEESRLEALLQLSKLGEGDLDKLTSFTLEQAIALTKSKIGFLGFLNEDETIYTLHAVSNAVVKECNVTETPLQWHVVNAGIWAQAIRERKTLYVNDYSKPHPGKKGLPSGHPRVKRFMVVPILDGTKITVVVGVGNKDLDYDMADERQLVLLLSNMWNYVQRNRSRAELQKAYETLEERVAQRTAQLAASASVLRESQEDLKRAQEVGLMGSWRVDLSRNVITWSDETHRIFGVPWRMPLTYEIFLEIVHPDDRPFVDAKWKICMQGEPYDVEHRIVVGDQVRWVREKAYPEFGDSGKLIGVFGITQDITERKTMEVELRRSRDNLEQRVKVRTSQLSQAVRTLDEQSRQLRQLAAQLSLTEQRERQRLAQTLHDHIQQLIVAARMQIDWISHIQERDVKELQETTAAAVAILDEAAEASRSLAIDLYPPMLQESGLVGALGWFASRMKERNRFTVNFSGDKEVEPSDSDIRYLLFECARELIFNAMKHSEVRKVDVQLVRTKDEHIKLIVCDGGKGFDIRLISDRTAGDSTFGLFNIQQRIKQVGGWMDIETAPGKGTMVALTVPFAPSTLQVKDKEPSPTIERPCESAQYRVLIVDDHEVVREGLKRMLKSLQDIEMVGEAADGLQAIELAERLKPDVVLMDVNLGKMNGMQTTRRILKKNPHIKVIGLSMLNDEETADAMYKAGAVAHLSKSGSSQTLIETIRSCIRDINP